MNNNYLITIDSKYTIGDEVESVSLSTFGDFWQSDDKYYITYKETKATGYDGDITTLTVENQSRATLERRGKTNSRLVMETGQKHICHYDTGFGDNRIGIFTDVIDNRLSQNGGALKLRYTLDLNSNAISTNELHITVKENLRNA